MKLLILLALSLVLGGCVNLGFSQSIVLEKSHFQLIKGNVSFDGKNLFEMLIQEELFDSDHNGYLPGDKIGEHKTSSETWFGSNGAGLVSRDTRTGKYTIYNIPGAFLPGNHLRIVYGDDRYLLFTLGDFSAIRRYGGLLVMDIRSRKFAGISRIATKGGVFGYFSSEELKKHRPGSLPPQMPWDNRRLKEHEYANITSDYELRNPSSIQRHGNRFTVSFNEDWKIKSFVTHLNFDGEDLSAWFDATPPLKQVTNNLKNQK